MLKVSFSLKQKVCNHGACQGMLITRFHYSLLTCLNCNTVNLFRQLLFGL